MDVLVGRILDANANRAREALRVMEDHARFALDDAALSNEAKSLRHALADALRSGGVDRLMTLRDTPGDVGTNLGTDQEYRRTAAADVVFAAGKRLSEALRVLEEYGKTMNVDMAARMENLRYRGYDFEKRLSHVIAARRRLGDVRLYVLITASLCALPWQEVVVAAAEGGATCFQLREKECVDRSLLEMAQEFRALCRRLDVTSIINDRADLAVAVDADGVHLGQDDLSVAAARRVVGPDRVIGVSTHTPDQVTAVVAECPDYIAVGPMFGTALKPEYGVAGPEQLAAARESTSLLLVAIGGIDAHNARDIVTVGGTTVAVCTAVIASRDPAKAASEILASLTPSD